MVGEKEAMTLKTIPLSKYTIQRRIGIMAEDFGIQIVENIRSTHSSHY